jgi:hypothetical protein
VEQIVIVLDEGIATIQNFTTQEGVVAIEDGKTFSEQ